jgi:hypothetical protein
MNSMGLLRAALVVIVQLAIVRGIQETEIVLEDTWKVRPVPFRREVAMICAIWFDMARHGCDIGVCRFNAVGVQPTVNALLAT